MNEAYARHLLPRGNGNVEEFDQRTTQRHYQISSRFHVGLVKTHSKEVRVSGMQAALIDFAKSTNLVEKKNAQVGPVIL